MRTARSFFYLLLAANIVLVILLLLPAIGIQLPWAPTGEGKRLSNQLTPEKIQIVADTPANAATTSTAQEAAAPAEPAPVAEPQICVAIGNIDADASQQLMDRAGRQEGLSTRVTGAAVTAYWVIIPPNGGKEGAIKRADTLTNAGFTDRFIVRDAGPNQFALSVGRFHNAESANRLLDALKGKGFKTARVEKLREDNGKSARTEITGRASVLEPLLKDFLAAHKDAQRDTCSAN